MVRNCSRQNRGSNGNVKEQLNYALKKEKIIKIGIILDMEMDQKKKKKGKEETKDDFCLCYPLKVSQ